VAASAARWVWRRHGPGPGFALKRAGRVCLSAAVRCAPTRWSRASAARFAALAGLGLVAALCALQREAWPWATPAPHLSRAWSP